MAGLGQACRLEPTLLLCALTAEYSVSQFVRCRSTWGRAPWWLVCRLAIALNPRTSCCGGSRSCVAQLSFGLWKQRRLVSLWNALRCRLLRLLSWHLETSTVLGCGADLNYCPEMRFGLLSNWPVPIVFLQILFCLGLFPLARILWQLRACQFGLK